MNGRLRVLLLLWVTSTACACAAPEDADDASASIVFSTAMGTPRAAHQATLLPDGRLLVTGGCTGRCDEGLASVEIRDVGSGRFERVLPMTIPRDSHAALALDDGRVLVVGGWSQHRATASVEIRDADEGRFQEVGALAVARAAPAAVRLADGRVLIVGGQNSEMQPLDSAEVFDPQALRSTPVAAMSVARVGHRAVLLSDGRVLVLGGRQARHGGILRTAEVFDPVSGRFEQVGDLVSPRHKHAAVRLLDGRVLVIGGADERDDRGRYRSTEIYDPETLAFVAGPSMRHPRFKLPDAVALLPTGAVLVAGGAREVEQFDAEAGAFSVLPGNLDAAMEFATANVLPDGRVLLLGGYDADITTSAKAWQLTPMR